MRISRSAIGLFLFTFLGANIHFTNANAATFASGTPCVANYAPGKFSKFS
jgi:hypothetical protein